MSTGSPGTAPHSGQSLTTRGGPKPLVTSETNIYTRWKGNLFIYERTLYVRLYFLYLFLASRGRPPSFPLPPSAPSAAAHARVRGEHARAGRAGGERGRAGPCRAALRCHGERGRPPPAPGLARFTEPPEVREGSHGTARLGSKSLGLRGVGAPGVGGVRAAVGSWGVCGGL